MTLRLYRSPKNQSDAVGDFFREAASARSNVDAVATGFVRLEPSLLVAEPADGAPAPYRGLVHSALRISTTIRFDPGPVTVDEVGTRAINQLAAYLRFLGIPKGKLRHMAFCDSVGDAGQNMEVARQLGRIVALELKQRRVVPGEVVSFGATYPLASDRLPAGRRINRRVETWILP
jgi:outer membrane protein OmpA-like peptidoglycan-associated protein